LSAIINLALFVALLMEDFGGLPDACLPACASPVI